ncbi:MAG: hypothetical protein IJU90_03895 [Bacteroidales bacterium]|nr:hypothetical protein [Bacteroidales bacterium]
MLYYLRWMRRQYGHKESAGSVHTLYRAYHSPKYTMAGDCAMVRSSNVYLVLLIKSRSRW